MIDDGDFRAKDASLGIGDQAHGQFAFDLGGSPFPKKSTQSPHNKSEKPTVFFAVRPNDDARRCIGIMLGDLRQAHGLKARAIDVERLHVSLPFVGYDDEDVVALAKRAGASVSMSAFDVRFDRVVSFKGLRERPVVMLGGDGVDGLKLLHKKIGSEMERVGLGKVSSNSTPHLTLLYDKVVVPEATITPVSWLAREFLLIRSHVGKSRHEILGKWPLA